MTLNMRSGLRTENKLPLFCASSYLEEKPRVMWNCHLGREDGECLSRNNHSTDHRTGTKVQHTL